jgi:hypothetical protein
MAKSLGGERFGILRHAPGENRVIVQSIPYPLVVSGGTSTIAFVGSKTTSYLATADHSVSLTDLVDSSGATATLAQNDFVIVAVSFGVSASPDVTFTAPSGWTQECDLFGGDTAAINFTAFSKKMGATPDTAVLCPGANNGNDKVSVVIHAFRGVDTTTPHDVANVTATGVDSGLPDPAAITPVTSGALIYVAGGASTGSTTGAPLTNPGDLDIGTNHFVSIFAESGAEGSVTGAGFVAWNGSGAFNPATWSGNWVSTTLAWCALTMALRPA